MADQIARQRRISAEFCRLKPGDVLTHPRSGEPIAKVIRFRNSTDQRGDKPNRYTVIMVLEDLDHG